MSKAKRCWSRRRSQAGSPSLNVQRGARGERGRSAVHARCDPRGRRARQRAGPDRGRTRTGRSRPWRNWRRRKAEQAQIEADIERARERSSRASRIWCASAPRRGAISRPRKPPTTARKARRSQTQALQGQATAAQPPGRRAGEAGHSDPRHGRVQSFAAGGDVRWSRAASRTSIFREGEYAGNSAPVVSILPPATCSCASSCPKRRSPI